MSGEEGADERRTNTVTYMSGGFPLDHQVISHLNNTPFLLPIFHCSHHNLVTAPKQCGALWPGLEDEKTTCQDSPRNQFSTHQSRFLMKAVYRHTHRFNVTQHLHTLGLTGCCSSNSVWVTTAASILCGWDISVTYKTFTFEMTHDISMQQKKANLFVCFFGVWDVLLTERRVTEEADCEAEYKIWSLTEAFSRTLAGAESGLHRAFVIRARFFTPCKSPRLGEEGERQRRMKADLKERN